MDIKAFKASLADAAPPSKAAPALAALWHEAKQDWARAHEMVQHQDDNECAWVHAYLHRKEGDLSNAGYWYRRARKPVANGSLDDEWAAIVSALLPADASS